MDAPRLVSRLFLSYVRGLLTANFSSPSPGGESFGGNRDPPAAVSFVSPEPTEMGDIYQWLIDNR